MAKCNLGKDKVEPTLVAGCVLWGQQITPKCMCYDVGWSPGYMAPPFTGVASCLHVCKLFDCSADHLPWFIQAFIDKLLLLLRILVDSR